ncbi:acyltransferase family protein [Pseudomonas sp. GXZC]|uniref:acyltransferase family protein n=1 Tax=Pseudomonas sp. GXZC TaxID=3003351 RepID=UPI0022AA78D4|nr:acyltransferase [Pseudomonas sp. GXZC]WAT30579.1 acyltransferase [Pseudomonas sp. GXZC]
MTTNNYFPKHLYSLDVLRGVAALVIVLVHWRYFLEVDITSPFRMDAQPFYNVFGVFYNYGWLAVDLFFSLSGFVFYWLYADAIRSKKVSGFSFFVMRFSRLYPLHFATFLFVLIAQVFVRSKTGSVFAFENVDFYHAVLNVFMVNSWLFNNEHSFNGPAWSLSVEALLYILFFLVCLLSRRRYWVGACIAIIGLALIQVASDVGRGVFSFFIGGLTFWLFTKITASKYLKLLAVLFTVIAIFLCYLVYADFKTPFFSDVVGSALEAVIPASQQFRIPGIIFRLSKYSITAVVFPSVILMCALVEAWRGVLGRKISFLGDISYSVYLLHFPLQLVFYSLAVVLEINLEVFYSPYSLLLFLVVLVVLALASYHYFELPMQKIIRQKLAPRPLVKAEGSAISPA